MQLLHELIFLRGKKWGKREHIWLTEQPKLQGAVPGLSSPQGVDVALPESIKTILERKDHCPMVEKQTGAIGNADYRSSTVLVFPSETTPAAAQTISAQGEEWFPHSRHVTGFLPSLLFGNKKCLQVGLKECQGTCVSDCSTCACRASLGRAAGTDGSRAALPVPCPVGL